MLMIMCASIDKYLGPEAHVMIMCASIDKYLRPEAHVNDYVCFNR